MRPVDGKEATQGAIFTVATEVNGAWGDRPCVKRAPFPLRVFVDLNGEGQSCMGVEGYWNEVVISPLRVVRGRD